MGENLKEVKSIKEIIQTNVKSTLINSKGKLENKESKEPEVVEPKNDKRYKRADKRFEGEVFNFLYDNQENLGITKVYRFENALVDGMLILGKNKPVILEIKYALNWDRSSVARIQFLVFLKNRFYKLKQKCLELSGVELPENAIIIFHHFSGDWEKKPEKRKEREYENGWFNFFNEEIVMQNKNEPRLQLKTNIVKLNKNKLFSVHFT